MAQSVGAFVRLGGPIHTFSVYEWVEFIDGVDTDATGIKKTLVLVFVRMLLKCLLVELKTIYCIMITTLSV